MAFRTIEAVIAPVNLHFVGDGFRVHAVLGREEPLTMKCTSLDNKSNLPLNTKT